MRNIITSLAKYHLILLGLATTASLADAVTPKKVLGTKNS